MLASFSTVPTLVSVAFLVIAGAAFWLTYKRFTKSAGGRLGLLVCPAVCVVFAVASSGIKHYPLKLTMFFAADVLLALVVMVYALHGYFREAIAAGERGEQQLQPTSGQSLGMLGALLGSVAVLIALEAILFTGFFAST